MPVLVYMFFVLLISQALLSVYIGYSLSAINSRHFGSLPTSLMGLFVLLSLTVLVVAHGLNSADAFETNELFAVLFRLTVACVFVIVLTFLPCYLIPLGKKKVSARKRTDHGQNSAH